MKVWCENNKYWDLYYFLQEEVKKQYGDNLDYIKYDLSTCKGMTTWGQRLCIYAPDKGLNMLFISEPNNPAWFPFPRNVSLFNENIIVALLFFVPLLLKFLCVIGVYKKKKIYNSIGFSLSFNKD